MKIPDPTTTAPTRKSCDNASVGVIITDHAGRFLMFDRATFPAGTAPVAGHVFDDHPGYAEAARAEVAEELGLTVTALESLPVGGWRLNQCRRAVGPRGVGHHWQVFAATATGELTPSARETRNARWLTADEVRVLAYRTAEYATGLLTTTAFAARPGLEPVWCRWLAELGVITLPPAVLRVIDDLATVSHPHATTRFAPTVCAQWSPGHHDPADPWICGHPLTFGPCPFHGTLLH